ncbi:MAG: hypothetical protein WA952_15960 [Lewinella sp.]
MTHVFRIVLLLTPIVMLAQADLVDTTYHPGGEVASVSWYTVKMSEELTKAEAFQRGLVYGNVGDTILMRDSIKVWDKLGYRIVDPAPPILPSRSRRSPQRVFNQEFIRLPRTYYSDYIGDSIRDTLRISNLADTHPADSVRITFTYPVFPTDTFLYLKDAEREGVPILLVPDTGSYRISVVIYRSDSTVRRELPVTVEGYDLAQRDFTAELPGTPALTLPTASRKRLLLHLSGSEKLLTVSLEGVVVDRFSVGRGRDEIRVEGWPPGIYSLRLQDLGTGTDRYALIRLA